MTKYNIDSFMKLNSIQPSYLFSVEFTTPDFVKEQSPINRIDYGENYDFMQTVEQNTILKFPDYKIKNVLLPKYIFKKETYSHSNMDYNFPVLETEGLELKIEIIENSNADLCRIIDYFTKRIIDSKGFYNQPKNAQFEVISVTAYTQTGLIASKHIFRECFYLTSTEISFDYTSNEQVSSLLTFLCNYYEVEYPETQVFSQENQSIVDGATQYYNPFGGN